MVCPLSSSCFSSSDSYSSPSHISSNPPDHHPRPPPFTPILKLSIPTIKLFSFKMLWLEIDVILSEFYPKMFEVLCKQGSVSDALCKWGVISNPLVTVPINDGKAMSRYAGNLMHYVNSSLCIFFMYDVIVRWRVKHHTNRWHSPKEASCSQRTFCSVYKNGSYSAHWC